MGRIVVAEESIEAMFNNFLSLQTKRLSTGLLLGQRTSTKDFIVHVAFTPQSSEEGVTSPRPGTSGNQPDPLWISQHAKQVERMLPGGIDILGIFLIGSRSELNSCATLIRNIFLAIQKSVLRKYLHWQFADALLLQMDSGSHSSTCSSVRIGSLASGISKADFKFLQVANPWTKICCHLAVSIPFAAPNVKYSGNVMKEMQNVLATYCAQISEAVVLFDGKLRDGSEVLCESFTGSKKAKRGKKNEDEEMAGQELVADILLKQHSNNEVIVSDMNAVLHVEGVMRCIAFLHSKATVEDAAAAIKKDISRSLTARHDVLSEDESLYEHEPEPKALFQLPQRVFLQMPKTKIIFSDYIFPSEDLNEAGETFQELLNIDARDKIVSAGERPAREEDLSILRDENAEESDAACSKHITQTADKNYLIPIASTLVAALSLAFSYLYLWQD